MENNAYLIAFIFIAIVILGNYLIIRHDINKIKEHPILFGLRVQSIKWDFFHLGPKGGPQYFKVEYFDKDGKLVRRTCRTGILQGVDWDV